MKQLKHIVLAGMLLLFAVSCKKSDSGSGTTYPRQVSITYRVSSTTTNSLLLITHENETGGLNTVNNPALPYTKTVTRTVNKYTITTLGFAVNPAKTVKMEILVDNQVVKSQESTSPNDAMSFTFQ